MKIFGIGKGKTGSNSLAGALRTLGFKVHHTGRGVYEKKLAVRDQLLHNWENQKPVLENVEPFDAYMDYPIHTMWKRIADELPEAKFILTYRPPADAALSWCRMMYSLDHDSWTPDRLSYKKYMQIVIDHNNDVLTHFYKSDRLLILDQRDPSENKWTQLCTFLGKDRIPDVDFPHTFNHTEWYMDRKLKGHGIYGGGGTPKPEDSPGMS